MKWVARATFHVVPDRHYNFPNVDIAFLKKSRRLHPTGIAKPRIDGDDARVKLSKRVLQTDRDENSCTSRSPGPSAERPARTARDTFIAASSCDRKHDRSVAHSPERFASAKPTMGSSDVESEDRPPYIHVRQDVSRQARGFIMMHDR